MTLLTPQHKSWIGQQEAPVQITITRRDIAKYSAATEQTQQRFIDGDEAPPMFIFNLFSDIPQMDELRPDGLPRRKTDGPTLPLKRVMAGGTQIIQHRPIRPNDVLVGTRTVIDMYEKEGKSGALIFTVRKLAIADQQGDTVVEEIQTSINR